MSLIDKMIIFMRLIVPSHVPPYIFRRVYVTPLTKPTKPRKPLCHKGLRAPKQVPKQAPKQAPGGQRRQTVTVSEAPEASCLDQRRGVAAALAAYWRRVAGKLQCISLRSAALCQHVTD